ncbi:eCIS core domain-containing protein [Monashia sp. NPDC004114]
MFAPKVATSQTRAAADSAMVQEVLRSPGTPFDAQSRSYFERRFGHDFSRVRIHSDDRAVASTDALGASAYAWGSHIVLAGDHLQHDRQLIAHELAHVVQHQDRSAPAPSRISRPDERAESQAEAAAGEVARGASLAGANWAANQPGTVYCQRRSRPPAPDPNLLNAPPPAAATMSRTEFEQAMRRFGVTRIATGTEAEQTSLSTPQGGAPPGGITLPNWQSWDPGTSSPVYRSIVDSFEDFEARVGGYPAVTEILFFKVDYHVNAAGIGVPDPDTGASFGAGQLIVYDSSVTARRGLPTGRSTAAANYPPVVIGLSAPGQVSGAPVPLPTREQNIRRIFTHELGHGLAEAAMAADPATFTAYRREIGWTATSAAQLFDIGVPAVQTAIASGTPPPAQYEITGQNWNSSLWIEQPLTSYMVSGGPSEDFAEAAMAYVEEPNLLAARSPRRFRFLDRNRAAWLPRLVQRPPIGDFFTTDRIRATA